MAPTGSYRPPFGAVGDGVDRLALHTAAEATIRALLDQITAALDTAPAEDTQTAAVRQEEPHARRRFSSGSPVT